MGNTSKYIFVSHKQEKCIIEGSWKLIASEFFWDDFFVKWVVVNCCSEDLCNLEIAVFLEIINDIINM